MSHCHAGQPSGHCDCCSDEARSAQRFALRASVLQPTRPLRAPTGPIVIDGREVDIHTASNSELLQFARRLAAQVKSAVFDQRAALRGLLGDSTATDGYKLNLNGGNHVA